MTISIQLIQIPDTETVPKREFYLDEAKVEIGRDFTSDICLPDMSGSMSRQHLLLSRLPGGGYTATDVSTNGAELNNTPMSRNEAQTLRDGDVLSFVGYKLLLGIVQHPTDAKITGSPPEGASGRRGRSAEFNSVRDTLTTEPLLPEMGVEAQPNEPERGFSETVIDLDEDLMFDPFADGPELKEPEARTPPFAQPQPDSPETVEPLELVSLPQPAGPGSDLDPSLRGFTHQETALQAVERALERFLDEVDPAALEEDYKEFIPRLMRRKKRFWTIHRRQFAKKKASGEFRRTFLALFAEEMRKQ